MAKKLVRNRAKCLKCGDIIESRHQHDFVRCSCGNLFIDGGTGYFTRVGIGEPGTMEDLCEFVEVNDDGSLPDNGWDNW